MRVFGVISLLIAVTVGVWWLVQVSSPATSPVTDDRIDYREALEAARAIPGAPAR